MASPATSQPPDGAGQSSTPSPQPTTYITPTNPIQNYANLLQPKSQNNPMQTLVVVPMKPVEYLHGEPIIRWKKAEVKQSIVKQRLQLAVCWENFLMAKSNQRIAQGHTNTM